MLRGGPGCHLQASEMRRSVKRAGFWPTVAVVKAGISRTVELHSPISVLAQSGADQIGVELMNPATPATNAPDWRHAAMTGALNSSLC